MHRVLLLSVALAAAAIPRPADAILVRADRDDAEYRELATRYPSAVGLGAAAGTGVLIAPRWMLTTAHRAAALRAMKGPLLIAGRPHEIQDVLVHPDWKPGGESDIALIFLRTAADGVEPTPIYRLPDEEGQAARIVGVGETGRIGEKATKPDGLARAAINTVDRVTPRTLGMRLKGPEDASDLQGALAPGDGGAPAFFEAGGRIFVAGIASTPEGANAGGHARNVGDWEVYARVSAFAAWIDDTMSKVAVEEAARETAKPRR
ncbi:MAG TPA: trypsin-like serine protease [Usitatibacteraceae bacterium]|nr:trypsin-like serine protease [Usitatibacteraceae bacterium]